MKLKRVNAFIETPAFRGFVVLEDRKKRKQLGSSGALEISTDRSLVGSLPKPRIRHQTEGFTRLFHIDGSALFSLVPSDARIDSPSIIARAPKTDPRVGLCNFCVVSKRVYLH